mmetsp:Transcript_17450/g.21310  ORF Transcript_17450/g.21310 Transcript_17450/m.21310 type:complete len:300 (-) Transcript_17450:40-939(-)
MPRVRLSNPCHSRRRLRHRRNRPCHPSSSFNAGEKNDESITSLTSIDSGLEVDKTNNANEIAVESKSNHSCNENENENESAADIELRARLENIQSHIEYYQRELQFYQKELSLVKLQIMSKFNQQNEIKPKSMHTCSSQNQNNNRQRKRKLGSTSKQSMELEDYTYNKVQSKSNNVIGITNHDDMNNSDKQNTQTVSSKISKHNSTNTKEKENNIDTADTGIGTGTLKKSIAEKSTKEQNVVVTPETQKTQSKLPIERCINTISSAFASSTLQYPNVYILSSSDEDESDAEDFIGPPKR